MDLFISPTVEFEKSAAQTALSEDPNAWSHEVLQELYKQAPYISDFSPHVEMEKVDGERGYGLGHVEVGNQTEMQTGSTPEQQAAAGVRAVRIPVIISDGMLEPFDLLITDDSKVQPLTEARLRAAIFRPQAFDVTSRTPGDQSMVGQLYPPFRQSYGFGGGVGVNAGMGKEGSALEQFLENGLEKTAGAFESYVAEGNGGAINNMLSENAGQTNRIGKKVASGEARLGMLDEFITKNAGARTDNAVRGAGTGSLLGNLGGMAAGALMSPKGRRLEGAYKGGLAGTVGGAGLGGLMGATKKASVLQAISGTLNEDDLDAFKYALSDRGLEPLFLKNASALAPSVEAIMRESDRPKLASVFSSMVRPSVVQLRRVDGGYKLKTANHAFWSPEVRELDRAEAVQELGEKVVLAADLEGAATMAEGAAVAEDGEPDSDMQGAGPVMEGGLYKVQVSDGQEAVGYAIPNLIGPDGVEVPLTLFTNGTQAAVQADVIGIPVDGGGGGIELPTSDAPTKRGVFATHGPEGLKATVPFTIQGSVGGMEGEPMSYAAQAFSGEDVTLSVQPNLETVVPSDGGLLIPESWVWVPLDKADEIVLATTEDDVNKTASMRRTLASVEVRGSGASTWSVSGPLVDKLANDQRESLGIDDAMFLLAGLGVEQGYGVRKLAEASSGMEPVRVRVGRTIKTAGSAIGAAREKAASVLAQLPQLKVPHLLKEAAAIGDPMAVDTVLSLGFINPENLTTFVSYLPVLEDAQNKLCDILMASRLGSLIETPDGSPERCVRSLEAVLEGLKSLAFKTN